MVTVSRTVCDLHLTRGEEVDATTRNVEIDGKKARIDLCESCYEESIRPVLNLMEQRQSQAPTKKAPPKKTARRTARKGSRGGRPSAAAIRKWAQEQGIEVSASGRVPREVRDQYLAAH